MIALLLLLSSPAQAAPRYPDTFIWGTAFSAHQTEGAFEGGENSDWFEFESGVDKKGKPNIANGDTTAIAIDFWHRYPEDLEIARSMGMETIRTSVAWEKIEPSPGVFNPRAIQHYRAIFQHMRNLGIRPMIALQHFVHPQWFHRQGGWENRESPKWFLRYATHVVEQLGDLCDLWITFNEPAIQAAGAYLSGQMPPNKKNLFASYEVAWNLARAHRMAANMIHHRQGLSPDGRGPDGRLRGVGLAHSLQIFDPARPEKKGDRKAAELADDAASWAFIRAIETGRMTIKIPKGFVFFIPGFDRELPDSDFEEPVIGPFQDWIGVNYYTRFLIKKKFWSLAGIEWLPAPGVQGDNGWTIYPEGLERVLRKAAEFGKPLVITENGLGDAADSRRPAFIRDHLRYVDRAMFGSEMGPPLDIRGYYFWSLLDNFEWLEGYSKRFGLVEVDYKNGLKRTPRGSASVYSREIEARK